MDKEKTYWNNNGRFQKEYDHAFETLVPTSGLCDTLEGELIRAVSRIYYDYYNNGFGNNWSGALEFLKEYGSISAKDYSVLREYSQGRVFGDRSDYFDGSVAETLESMVDDVVSKVNSTETHSKNPCDMFDLQLPDDFGDEDDFWDDEDDFGDEE